MTFDDLSDDAKLLFMIWGLAANFSVYARGHIAAGNPHGFTGFALKKWCEATGKPAEDVHPAYEEMRAFMQHCQIAREAIANERRKDRERMRRLTG